MKVEDLERFSKLEWMLDETAPLSDSERGEYIPPYGDVTELNSCRLIMDSVGKETLKKIGEYAVSLLGTSLAIYEANGDYAFGMFTSGWCKMMDAVSRNLCNTDDNKDALSCGKWLCHENCWNDSAKKAMETGQPTDIECVGGIHLYGEPIFAGQQIVGAINLGYGDPPKDASRLQELSDLFCIDLKELKETGDAYKSRPDFMVDLAKNLLRVFAKTIGEIVEKSMLQSSLEKNEIELQKVQALTHIGSWYLDIETNQVEWTEELYKMYGFDPNLPPPPYTEHMKLFTPESWDLLSESLAKTSETGIPYELELRTVRKDKSTGWMWVRGEAVKDKKGKIVGLWGAAQDISERKQLEVDLSTTRDLLDETGKIAKVGGWEIDLISNTLAWTDETFRIHEVMPGNQPPLADAINFYHPDDRAMVISAVENAIADGEPFDFEARLITKNDKQIWVRAKGHRVSKNGRNITVRGIFQDITDRKLAEQELIAKEAKFRSYVDNAPDGIFVTNEKAEYIEVNRAACEMTGYTEKELLNLSIPDLIEPNDVEKAMNGFHELTQKGSAQRELVYLTKTGEHRFWDVAAVKLSDTRFLGFAKDITGRKQAEKAQKESEELYRLLADNITDNIWILDLKTLIFSYLSPSVINITGYTDKEAEGFRLQDVLTPSSLELATKTLTEELTKTSQNLDPEKSRTLELEQYHKNGTIVWTEVSLRFIYDQKKQPISILGVTRNIAERKKAEQTLKENEEKLRNIFENSTNLFYSHTPEHILTYLSPQVEDILGYTQEEAMINWTELVSDHPINEIGFKHTVKAIETGERQPVYELEMVRKDGRKIWVEVREAPLVENGNVVSIVGSLNDITERKVAEEKLKDSEQQKNLILSSTSEMIVFYDTNLNILWANKAAAVSVGKTEEEIIGMDCYELWGNGSDICDGCPVLKARELKTPQQLERQSPDGRIWKIRGYPVLDDMGNVISLIEFGQNITDLKKNEARIKESEARLRDAQRIANIGNWSLDLQTGRVEMSDEMLNLIGLKNMNEALDVSAHEKYYTHESWQRFTEAVDTARTTGKSYEIEMEFSAKEATYRHAVARGEALYGDDNKIIGLKGTLQDITQRKKYEAEKQRLEEHLRQSQKLEAIGTLAGGIAHDFNNILSSVIGFTELALDDVEKDSPVEDSLQEIYTGGKRARDLVKQILAFSRQSDKETKPIQLDTIAKEVLKLLRASIPTTIRIDQDIQKDLTIMGNSTQVHQILMNICTNAAQAMEDNGGTLEVSIKDVVINKKDSLKNVNPGEYAEIKISDTGVGIDPEVMDKIFDPYFTTKETGKGSGMGLALVHGIITTYNGMITADSEPGHGAVFTIHLPLIKSRRENNTYQPEILPTGDERILIVDDELPIVKMSSQILQKLGYEVVFRTSSTKALELFRSNPDDFDLVITDMTMPDMTGEKLSIELMKIRPDIPVILCSGYSSRISDTLPPTAAASCVLGLHDIGRSAVASAKE